MEECLLQQVGSEMKTVRISVEEESEEAGQDPKMNNFDPILLFTSPQLGEAWLFDQFATSFIGRDQVPPLPGTINSSIGPALLLIAVITLA